MADTPARVAALFFGLVGVWALTYWLYEPASPATTFGDRPDWVDERLSPEDDRAPASPGGERTGSGLDGSPQPAPGGAAPAAGGAGPAEGSSAAAGGASAQPTTPVEGVLAPEFFEYVVREGDTSWERISEVNYGDRRYWRAVASANPLVDPRRLRVGETRLRIPRDPTNPQGVAVRVHPDGRVERLSPPPPPAGPEPVRYIVQPGDTLSGIAKAYLGASSRWREIYEANAGIIGSPESLKPGMEIIIPR